jgi:hypothetical protein
MTIDRQIGTDLPPELTDLLADLPVNVDRKTGARLVTKHFFPTSDRTLERWPLPWQRVNGRAITPTIALLALAYAKLAAAPVVMGGQRTAPEDRAV